MTECSSEIWCCVCTRRSVSRPMLSSLDGTITPLPGWISPWLWGFRALIRAPLLSLVVEKRREVENKGYFRVCGIFVGCWWLFVLWIWDAERFSEIFGASPRRNCRFALQISFGVKNTSCVNAVSWLKIINNQQPQQLPINPTQPNSTTRNNRT